MRYLISLLVCASAIAADLGNPSSLAILKPASGAAGFTANTAVFDGSNDYMRQTTAWTGLADSKVFTLSSWVKFEGGDGVQQTIAVIHSGTSSRLLFDKTAANKLHCEGRDSGGSIQLAFTCDTSLTVASGWTHVYVCIDLANQPNSKVYFNGVLDSTTWTTHNDATLDLVPSSFPRETIGGNSGSTPITLLNGALAEFWFDNVYLDDVGKFASGGSPISLGANGETPTGSAPAVYYSLVGSGDSWAGDSSGNGNNATVTGALGTTTPP